MREDNLHLTSMPAPIPSPPVGGGGSATSVSANATVAGKLIVTTIGAPTTPSAGTAAEYVDSTSKNIAVKDDAGVVKHGVQSKAAVTNQFLTSIADDGSSVLAQPSFTNLSGSLASGQFGPLTGDVATSGYAATIGTNVVTNAKAAQAPTLTLKGNNTGGTANVADLTVAQVNAILPVVTPTLNGLAPLSGGGTTNFLRADGTWAAPPGGGSAITALTGDVTATGPGSVAGTIAGSVVTNAKLATMAGNTIKMNSTGITTNPQDVTMGSAFDSLHAAIGTLASAGTTDLSTVNAETISITGTATITALGTMVSGVIRRLVFTSTAILTHNSTSLIMRLGTTRQMAAGDVVEMLSLGSGNWREVSGRASEGVDVQVFTASGTWTIPSGARLVQAYLVGGGGGGGGGRRDAAGTTRGGGGGGAGATAKTLMIDAAVITANGATAAITIGAGGTAGTSATSDTTSGGTGGTGGTTSIGGFASAVGGGGGGGGTTAAGTAGAAGIVGTFPIGSAGGAGGAGGVGAGAAVGSTSAIITQNTVTMPWTIGPPGGGGGGGITSGNATEAGAAGAANLNGTDAGGVGAVNASGTAGTSHVAAINMTGAGGGGGSSGTNKTGGNGGNFGAGAGGGGASVNGTASGAGGVGGGGAVVIITTCG